MKNFDRGLENAAGDSIKKGSVEGSLLNNRLCCYVIVTNPKSDRESFEITQMVEVKVVFRILIQIYKPGIIRGLVCLQRRLRHGMPKKVSPSHITQENNNTVFLKQKSDTLIRLNKKGFRA